MLVITFSDFESDERCNIFYFYAFIIIYGSHGPINGNYSEPFKSINMLSEMKNYQICFNEK